MPWIDIDTDSHRMTVGKEVGFLAGAWRCPHPPLFFARVADKGLRLDAASRASRFGELNGGSETGAEAIGPNIRCAQDGRLGPGTVLRVRSFGLNSLRDSG